MKSASVVGWLALAALVSCLGLELTTSPSRPRLGIMTTAPLGSRLGIKVSEPRASASGLRGGTPGVAFARPQSATPAIHDSKDIEVGRGMFRIYCAACHGIQARGGLGPDLTRGVYNSGDKDSDLVRTISQGVPGTEMTGFEGTLSAESIHRIVAFIRSVSRPDSVAPRVGDPARGEALFWGKGNCGQCHTVNAKGGRFGPDLSRAGRQRSYAYLREAILDPDRDITEGYRTLTVVLPDGRKITGLERGLDNFTAQLTDASGKFYSFDKSRVRSVRPETHSLMPSNYGRLLTPGEIDDLLAYLSGLPRKP